ncbi:hypothetical protein G3I40_12370 [Streptomyces sp. SID14478]|uniref:hypothetical protein n=1 Tax=Streptomyces sp. SID14478 TaxID=2706073 RepID=UPI0013DB8535|nr:hypothetical protein [Streptomyces sp. SID14478]NEB76010.1 hypothetical protein [Streptomyces sp. SID14478]
MRMPGQLRPRIGLALVALVAAGCTTTQAAEPQDASTGAPRSFDELVDRVQKDVATAWPHTGQVWPGADFAGHNLLLTDGTDTFAVDTHGKTTVSAEDLEKAKIDIPAEDAFDVVTWDDKPSLIIHVPKDLGRGQKSDPTGLTAPQPGYTFALAGHEQFHPYVQNEPRQWPSLKTLNEQDEGDRTEMYPLKSGPRVDRAMVYNSLLSALTSPDERDQHLSEAAWWNAEWRKDYPDDAKGQDATDLLEGTAKYFEQYTLAMTEVDKPTDAAQVRDRLATTLKPMAVASKGIEPYAIGTVALLNADAQGKDFKKKLTTEPTTPLAELLKGVAPSDAQKAPDNVQEGIDKGVKSTNAELAKSIDPFVKNVQDAGHSVLMLPVESVSGSMGGKGFYTTEELPVTITPEAKVTFKPAGGRLRAENVTVGEIDQDGKGYFAIPIKPGEGGAELKGSRLTLHGGGLDGSLTVKATTDGGQNFLYAQ